MVGEILESNYLIETTLIHIEISKNNFKIN